MNYFKGLLWIIWTGLATAAMAQKTTPPAPAVPAEVQEMQAAYHKLTKYEMDLEYIVYKNATATQPLQTELTKLQRNGTSMHTRIATVELLVTPQYALRINHKNKSMRLSKTVAQDLDEAMKVNWQMFFKLATNYTAMPSKDPKTVGYKISVGAGLVETMEIYIDTQTHLLQSCVLFYRESHTFDKTRGKNTPEKPKLVVHYKNFNPNPSFSASTFAIDKFVQQKGKTWQPTANYKDWTLNLGNMK